MLEDGVGDAQVGLMSRLTKFDVRPLRVGRASYPGATCALQLRCDGDEFLLTGARLVSCASYRHGLWSSG